MLTFALTSMPNLLNNIVGLVSQRKLNSAPPSRL